MEYYELPNKKTFGVAKLTNPGDCMELFFFAGSASVISVFATWNMQRWAEVSIRSNKRHLNFSAQHYPLLTLRNVNTA